MKTIFQTCPYTGKPSLTLIAQTDQERSLMNQLCSLTFEERVHHTRLRTDRQLDNKNNTVALCIRKKTFLHQDILISMGFEDLGTTGIWYGGEWYHIEQGRFFYHPYKHFFVDLRGTSRVWNRIFYYELTEYYDISGIVAHDVITEHNSTESLHLRIVTQSYRNAPQTERRYCQTVEELERFMKGRCILKHEELS